MTDTSLHLIWGPTSTGKTAASIKLARRIGAPVIALDRVQCCPQIARGSGRPAWQELDGTARIYLVSRRLSEGVPSAPELNAYLKERVAEWSTVSPQIILEGGSISLLNHMASDPYWQQGFSWSFQRFYLQDPQAFLARATRRVAEMFDPTDGAPSLLDELLLAWRNPHNHAVLEDVDGYRAAIGFARRHGLSVPQLAQMSGALKRELIDDIAREYLDHAQMQEAQFPAIPAQWRTAPSADVLADAVLTESEMS